MEDGKLIQLSIQMPVEALFNFSRLVEQLRRISEAAGGAPASAASPAAERAESSTFDRERFQLLDREPEIPESVRSPRAEAKEAPAVHQPSWRELPLPERAGETVSAAPVPHAVRPDTAAASPNEPEAARLEPSAREEQPAPEPQHTEDRLADGMQTAEKEPNGPEPVAKAVRAEPDTPVADAPSVRMDPESQIPAAEAVWNEAQGCEPEAAALRAEAGPGVETPLGAGFVVSSGADAPPSRQGDISEELVVPGAAPLTAEAVSLAFRRDGRRYDNGFPLY